MNIYDWVAKNKMRVGWKSDAVSAQAGMTREGRVRRVVWTLDVAPPGLSDWIATLIRWLTPPATCCRPSGQRR